MAIPCTLSIDKVQPSVFREIDVSTGTHPTPDSTLASNMIHLDLRNCGSGLKDSRPPPEEEDPKLFPTHTQEHFTAPNGNSETPIIEGNEGAVMEPARNGYAQNESNGPSNKFRISVPYVHTTDSKITDLVTPHLEKESIIPSVEETKPANDHLWTPEEFYNVDNLDWGHFTSVANGYIQTWVNSYYNSVPPPEPREDNSEGDGTILEPFHVNRLLRGRENEIRNGRDGKTLPEESPESTQKPRRSLFDRSEYPAPWPLIPSSQRKWQYLEHQLRHGSLPTTLIVHDPWNTLAVDSCNEFGEAKKKPSGTWMEHEDIVHIYDLKLTAEAQARVKDEDSKVLASSAASPDTSQNNTLNGQKTVDESDISMFTEWTGTGVKITLNGKINELPGYQFCPKTSLLGPIYPPLFVIFECPPIDLQPANPTPPKIEAAHLYIDPTSWIGYGHHSFIVGAELEIPRSAIVRPDNTDYRPKVCVSCIKNDLRKKLEILDGKCGEKMEARWKQRTATMEPTSIPHLGSEPGEEGYVNYAEGPLRPIRITLRLHDHGAYQCQYSHPPPPSTLVRVLAKLSNVDDDHLEREARNYQEFPQHMFEHRTSTYNLPRHPGSVPMGAIVPQFYGYYAPRGPNANGAKRDYKYHQKRGQYKSRILLLEDCGLQISLNDMTTHEKKICASLMARFHDAGWAHESVHYRNFVQRPGPINIRVSKRSRNQNTFRLLDFGRSYHMDSGLPSPSGCMNWEHSIEFDEEDTKRIFGIDIGKSS